MNKNVTQWADEIQQIAHEEGESVSSDFIAIGLALIMVESAGDPEARRPRSQFYGLLQQGRYASLDLGWEDRGRRTAERLHGNGVLAIRSWYQLLQRYASRWEYDGAPHHLTIAVLWKGGAGTARRIRDKIQREGVGIWEACRWIETHPNRAWRIPNLTEYLRRTDRHHKAALDWVREHEQSPACVIEPMPTLDMSGGIASMMASIFEIIRRQS